MLQQNEVDDSDKLNIVDLTLVLQTVVEKIKKLWNIKSVWCIGAQLSEAFRSVPNCFDLSTKLFFEMGNVVSDQRNIQLSLLALPEL